MTLPLSDLRSKIAELLERWRAAREATLSIDVNRKDYDKEYMRLHGFELSTRAELFHCLSTHADLFLSLLGGAAPTTQETNKPEIDKRTTGLYNKFRVERTDGKSAPGQKHDGCDYFVLDVTHDPHAAPALHAYAASCEADYPLLARDLRARLGGAAPLQTQWQPIDSAPKDGRYVMLYGCEFHRHWFGTGYYFKGVPGDGEGWVAFSFYTLPNNDASGSFTPTHWQPLPSPPEEERT